MELVMESDVKGPLRFAVASLSCLSHLSHVHKQHLT